MKRCVCICVLALSWAGCSREEPADPAAATNTAGATHSAGAETREIAVIPKGTTHDFWKSVHAGAVKAQRELGGVQVVFRGPEREDDREQQIALVQNFISRNVDAIVLAPLDDRSLVPPVRQARQAGIPVVIIDSDLSAEAGKDFVSFVATDNYRGGVLAAERIVEVLGGKGTVLLLRYQEGSASTVQREQGFTDTLAEHEGIELVDPKRYAGATRDTAQQASENLLTAYDKVNAIFCPNESSTFGMLLALRARGLAGRIRFVGFDSSEGLVDALRKKEIDGLVVQNPMRMGYLGVKSAVDHLEGRSVPRRQDTGVTLVRPDTVDFPENRDLIEPDLDTYLE
jgi:ribose transport system substrate-binding protein